ncbi:hypothetical protein JTB14_035484 [Gonioctena quinquepunctata]|nr:hypothetical protein JTB14_035484 [Gonioctena quinquepunctata]
MLSPEEIEDTTIMIIRLIQTTDFKQEKISLEKKKQVWTRKEAANRTLRRKGHPTVDGKLHATLLYNKKHFIILPRHNHVTTLIIIRDAHKKTLQGGNHLAQAYIRQKFWIINAKKAARAVISKVDVRVHV